MFFKLFLLLLLLVPSFVVYQLYFETEHKTDLEPFKRDGWFGKEILKKDTKIPKDPTTIKEFVLNVSNTTLDDLRQRLQRSRFIESLPSTGFQYGFNSEFLKEINKYWIEKYDWRKQEKFLNQYPQYKTKIEGLDIHFVHVKPKTTKAKITLPLMLLHGWPGTYMEYFPLIEQLSNANSDVAFELIVPSIPGYGFSEAPHQVGFHGLATARIFNKLMTRLGHNKYFVHGGDWGALIAKCISVMYPENTRALHVVQDMFLAHSFADYIRMTIAYFFPKQYFGDDSYNEEWKKLFPLTDRAKFMLQETGYMHIQATKPDTIGSALHDTPIGLAAYILEKYSTWTDRVQVKSNDGGLKSGKFSMDQLLNTIMIYWTSGNIASSQRYYYENMQNFNLIQEQIFKTKSKMPTGIIDATNDLIRTSEKFSQLRFPNLIHFETINGGHFLALEKPKEVALNLQNFAKKVLDFEKKKEQLEKDKKKHDEI